MKQYRKKNQRTYSDAHHSAWVDLLEGNFFFVSASQPWKRLLVCLEIFLFLDLSESSLVIVDEPSESNVEAATTLGTSLVFAGITISDGKGSSKTPSNGFSFLALLKKDLLLPLFVETKKAFFFDKPIDRCFFFSLEVRLLHPDSMCF